MAVCGLASTSSLRTSTLPAYLAASFSISGATMRHGPHHSAQKSTTTGLSLWSTSVSNVASVTSGTLDDIGFLSPISSADSAGDLLQQTVGLEDSFVHEPIEDRASLAAAGHQARRAQHREVLAHVRHLAPDLARQVAHAPLSVRQSLDDAESLRIGEGAGDGRGPRAGRIGGLHGIHRSYPLTACAITQVARDA